MNGVFDLGGTDGLGPIEAPPAEPPFFQDWERTVFTMQLSCMIGGWFGLDSFRHGIELMDPVTYLSSSYYEHWLHSFEHHGIAKGHIDPDELDRRTQYFLDHPDAALPVHEPKPQLIEIVDALSTHGAPASRPTEAPIGFAVGDVVRVRGVAPLGHTRLARYVRGKVGTVVAYRGSFVFPDSAGNDRGEDPHHLYTIRLEGTELWGEEYADPRTSSTFDVWEPYIELVRESEGAGT
ncbi:nitrile hydratase subunit beta [Nocardioides ginsengisoli]|uniref:Nitrile hydratase subunit beta n=1 Tax=Nocardioides ginsengisoli TaxID=363868 RepID=A0ABW3W571_9ACTN